MSRVTFTPAVPTTPAPPSSGSPYSGNGPLTPRLPVNADPNFKRNIWLPRLAQANGQAYYEVQSGVDTAGNPIYSPLTTAEQQQLGKGTNRDFTPTGAAKALADIAKKKGEQRTELAAAELAAFERIKKNWELEQAKAGERRTQRSFEQAFGFADDLHRRSGETHTSNLATAQVSRDVSLSSARDNTTLTEANAYGTRTNADTGRFTAQANYDLGQQRLGLDRDIANNNYNYQQGTIDIGKYNAIAGANYQRGLLMESQLNRLEGARQANNDHRLAVEALEMKRRATALSGLTDIVSLAQQGMAA